jgi:hypothetical protein
MPCMHIGGSKGLAPLILYLHASWRWVIKRTSRPLYPREGTYGNDVGWVPESVWAVRTRENLLFIGPCIVVIAEE